MSGVWWAVSKLLRAPVDVQVRLKVSESKRFFPGGWWVCVKVIVFVVGSSKKTAVHDGVAKQGRSVTG